MRAPPRVGAANGLLSGGRADLRDDGAAYRRAGGGGGHVVFDRERVTAGRNGPDVFADERFPFGALAEADRWPRRRGASSRTTLRPRSLGQRLLAAAPDRREYHQQEQAPRRSASSVALIGRRRKTEKSPSASSIARRKFSSSCGPSTRPSNSGAGSTPTLMKK